MQNKPEKGDLVSFRNNRAFGIVLNVEPDVFGSGGLSAMIRIAADKANNSDPVKFIPIESVKVIVKGYEPEANQTAEG